MGLFYLSFQKSPFISVSPNEVVTICPTIVNDLRDEVYQVDADEEPLSICVAWVAREGNGWKKLSAEENCPWEGPLSAYKQCQIKVPSRDNLKDIQDIHLALWMSPAFANEKPKKKRKVAEEEKCPWIFVLDMIPAHKDNVIVPVLSAPIKVLSKDKEKADNHRSYSTIRLIQMAGLQCIELCEESGYELDKHIWDASLFLSLYLKRALNLRDEPFSSSLLDQGSLQKGIRVVELGAGTGLVTLMLSSILAPIQSIAESNAQFHLTATDLSSALSLLEHNISVNHVNSDRASSITIDCQELDWLEETSIEGTQLILISDCTYNPIYFKPLCKTIKALLEKASKPAICLLAKKHRHCEEEALWVEVEQHGLTASLLSGEQATVAGSWGLWKLVC